MQSEIEKLAEQLWAVYFEGTAWKKINYPSNSAQKKSFERLAKHVQRLVLETRIDELVNLTKEDCNDGFMCRISDLNDKLSSLTSGR